MDTTITLSAIPGDHLSLLRAQLKYPDGSPAIEWPLVERVSPQGTFDGSVTFSMPVTNLLDPYIVEVKAVATQNTAGYAASVDVVVPEQPYGYWTGSEWSEELPGSTAVVQSGLYATQTDFVQAFGEKKTAELSNRDSSASVMTIDVNRLEIALNYGRSRINSRLRNSRYLVPLSGMDDDSASVVRDLCLSFALGWLYQKRIGKDLDGEGRPTHPAKQQVQDAVDTLRNIAAGTLKILAAKRTVATGVVVIRDGKEYNAPTITT